MNRTSTWVGAGAAVATLALAACAGGGGALTQSLDTQDRPPISNEGVASSTESARNSLEGVASSTERAGRSSVEGSPTGGLACAGTYRCTVDGRTSSSAVVLAAGAGGCFALTDGEGTTLDADGSIRQNGQVIATWASTGSGFTYSVTTTQDGRSRTTTISCTKVSDSVSPPASDDDDDDDSAPPVVTIDAGAPG